MKSALALVVVALSSPAAFGQSSAGPRPDFGAENWVVEMTKGREAAETGPAIAHPRSEPATSDTEALLAAKAHRPYTGILADRIIYLLGGHGRTYMEESFDWQTQRSPIHGMVEDYGNQDQAGIFAELALRTGATIAPLRPLHHQPNERIVTHQSPGFRLVGEWNQTRALGNFARAADGTSSAWTKVARRPTAIARFEPWIPANGYYPVYAWAPAGPQQAITRYRVHHPGGREEVVVNHRRVGNGWVYLGRYYFPKGWGYAVEITNEATDPADVDAGRVVVADAVRFGNGLGDTPRPGGISGHTREDEASIYWMRESGGQDAPRTLHTLGPDRGLTVGGAPRYAAYLNRELDGRFMDRVYLSFHSNAAGSRGALGLWVRDPNNRPDFQEQLAELTGRRINLGLVEEILPGLPAWARRTRHQLNHITFGELRRDNIQNEMSSTIVETAFFDQPDDALWLTDPRGMTLIAQGALAGLIEWFMSIDQPGLPVALPPPAPEDVSVRAIDEGLAEVRFVPGRTGPVRGGAATRFLLELSGDGKSFQSPIDLGASSPTTFSIPLGLRGAATSSPVYLRLRAQNPAGTSLPSTVAALRRSPPGEKAAPLRVLLVDGHEVLDASQNFQQVEAWGRNPENIRPVARVRPMDLLEGARIPRLAEALCLTGLDFDMASPADVEGARIDLSSYRAVWLDTGGMLADHSPVSGALSRALSQYAQNGGRVVVTGSEAGRALAQEGGAGGELLLRVFAARPQDAPVHHASGVRTPDGAALSAFEASSSRLPVPRVHDTFIPEQAGRELLSWDVAGAGAAAISGPRGVIAAFSPASLAGPGSRAAVISQILQAAIGP